LQNENIRPLTEVLMQSRTFRNKSLGQGMTEYIIIVALIAVAAIAVYQLFGKTVRNQTAGIAQEVAGKDGSAAIAKAGDAASAASTAAGQDTTLSTYGNQKGKATGGGG
jgi:type IV pilus assembly protein PilA